MPVTEINKDVFDEAARVLGDQPMFVVNLVRFREQAEYSQGDAQPPCSGRDAYFTRYVPAFAEVTQGQGIAAQWLGEVHAALAGPADEAWDGLAIVRYPNFATFRTTVESAAYIEKADLHRRAALADLRLLATTPTPLPDQEQDAGR